MALDSTNLVSFIRGKEANLPKTGIVKDTFYLTTDTHRLYVGVDSTHTALINSAVKVYPTLKDLTDDKQYLPEVGDIAFIEKDNTKNWVNALVMYVNTADGKAWIQINYSDTDIRKLISDNAKAASDAQATADAAMPKSGGEFSGKVTYASSVKVENDQDLTTKAYVDAAVTGLAIGEYVKTSVYEEDKREINLAITDADSKAGAAATVAERAEGKADANANLIGTLGNKATTVVGYIDAVKETADKAAVKSEVEQQIGEINISISDLDGKIDGVGEDLADLDAATVKATNGVFTNAPKIGADTVATTKNISDAVNELTQGATSKTFKAIEEAHAIDISDINGKLDAIAGNLEDLSNVMNFVGTTTTELVDGATTGTIAISGNASYTPDKGDVVIYGGEEFVWDGSKWAQIGSADATTAAIGILEGRIAVNEGAISTLNTTTIPGINALISDVDGKADAISEVANAAATKDELTAYKNLNDPKVKALEDSVNHTTTGLAKTYDLASKAATQVSLEEEASARQLAINEIIAQLTWGSFDSNSAE